MKTGPAPKPTALKRLAGQRITNKYEPQPDRLAQMPKAPTHLNRYAKRFWRETGQQLINVGVLTQADLPTFEICCTHYGTVAEVSRQIQLDGVTQKDERGLVRKHPLFAVLHSASQLYRAYSGQFGLDPASRTRITVEPPQDDEAKLFDELFG